jgi:hypothetical protein
MDRQMEDIVRQAPKHITYDVIKEIYERNNKDKLSTLMEIWDIKEDKINMVVDDKQVKWCEIRETCDAYDIEMSTMLEDARKNIRKI